MTLRVSGGLALDEGLAGGVGLGRTEVVKDLLLVDVGLGVLDEGLLVLLVVDHRLAQIHRLRIVVRCMRMDDKRVGT
jgi:hypothetical protein